MDEATFLASKNPSEKRTVEYKFMNVAKALGICFIVLGHSFTEDSQSVIRAFIYLFHVPLFFFISGYFFKDKYIYKPVEMIISRVKSLYFSFLKWTIFFLLLHNVFFKFNIYSEEETFHGYIIPYYSNLDLGNKLVKIFLFRGTELLLGGFWFLQCLFFTSVAFLIISVLIMRLKLSAKAMLIVIISSFITGNLFYISHIRISLFPWDVRLPLLTLAPYYLGYIYKKYEHLLQMKWQFALASFVALCIFTKINILKINDIYSLMGSFETSILFLICTPLLGIYLVIYVSKLISEFSVGNIFNYIGKKTITIFALHLLCFKIVNLALVRLYELPLHKIASFPVIEGSEAWFLAYFFSGLLIPLLLSIFYDSAMSRFTHRL